MGYVGELAFEHPTSAAFHNVAPQGDSPWELLLVPPWFLRKELSSQQFLRRLRPRR